jgi:ATP-binding cassette subfamily B (MDR/TAP) protein 1
VGFFELYRFADKKDKILIFLGVIFSCATGCGFPFFAYIWGKMTDVFALGGQKLVDEASYYRDVFLLIGTGTFVAGWISFGCWIIVG